MDCTTHGPQKDIAVKDHSTLFSSWGTYTIFHASFERKPVFVRCSVQNSWMIYCAKNLRINSRQYHGHALNLLMVILVLKLLIQSQPTWSTRFLLSSGYHVPCSWHFCVSNSDVSVIIFYEYMVLFVFQSFLSFCSPKNLVVFGSLLHPVGSSTYSECFWLVS